jgi:hypothetical protein
MTLDAALLNAILEHERRCLASMEKPAPGNRFEEMMAWKAMLRDRHATAQQFAEEAIAQVLEDRDV